MNAPHRTTARVRYGETDQMGVVYHANYIVYFELGRTELMRERGIEYAAMERAGLSLAVVEMGSRFLKPARYDETLVVETRLVEASGVRLRFEYSVRRDDGPDAGEVELCRGFTVLACVDRSGRPTRIPDPWRERIERVVAS